MTDYVRVQDGDLDDAATVTTVTGHKNLADYVGYGLELNADFSADPITVSITEGKAFVLLTTQFAPGAGEDVHDCLLTAHYDDRDGIGLVTSERNFIWAYFNMGTDDSPRIEVTDTNVEPSEDSVLLGWVEPGTETVRELNRDPDGSYHDLTTDTLSVGEAITWPDGETSTEHPLTFGEEIYNQNNYYDVDANEPPGTVAHADHANTADHATTAGEADFAKEAENAEYLDGYSASQILDAASKETAREWEPLLDTPFEKDYYDGRLDFNFYADQPYDRYRVRVQTENDNNYIGALGYQVNGVTGEKYRKFNLTPEEYKDAPESYDEVQYLRDDHWTGAEAMAHSHGTQEFYVACPRPIVGRGARRRNPLFAAGEHHTGTIRQYTLAGHCEIDAEMVDHIRLYSHSDGWAVRIQVYGQNMFPELD